MKLEEQHAFDYIGCTKPQDILSTMTKLVQSNVFKIYQAIISSLSKDIDINALMEAHSEKDVKNKLLQYVKENWNRLLTLAGISEKWAHTMIKYKIFSTSLRWAQIYMDCMVRKSHFPVGITEVFGYLNHRYEDRASYAPLGMKLAEEVFGITPYEVILLIGCFILRQKTDLTPVTDPISVSKVSA